MTDPNEPTYCEYDGKLLKHEFTRGRRKRFCTNKCRYAARRRRDAERAAASPPELLFARTVSGALAADGRPLRTLSKLLPQNSFISPSTLSQWQNGRAVPRVTEDNQRRIFALERLLDAPGGGLMHALIKSSGRDVVPPAALIPQPRRSSELEPEPTPTMEQAAQEIMKRVTELGGWDNPALPLTTVAEHYIIGHLRRPQRSKVTMTVNPLHSGITHYWVRYSFGPSSPLTLKSRSGCRRGHVIHSAEPVEIDGRPEILAAAELTFPPLPAGEEYCFGFDLVYDRTATGPLPERIARRMVMNEATREVRMDITFEPPVRPRQLHSVRWPLTPANHPPIAEAEIQADADGHGEPLVLKDPEPGGYGYQWQWPTDEEALPSSSQSHQVRACRTPS